MWRTSPLASRRRWGWSDRTRAGAPGAVVLEAAGRVAGVDGPVAPSVAAGRLPLDARAVASGRVWPPAAPPVASLRNTVSHSSGYPGGGGIFTMPTTSE